MDDECSIVSFNVNGLKAALRRTGFRSTSLAQFLESLTKDAAVVCLQEVKMTHQELQYDFCNPMNWEAYYSLCGATTATKKIAAGYSGVATFCRCPSARPLEAVEGFSWVMNRICLRAESSTDGDLGRTAKRRRTCEDGSQSTDQRDNEMTVEEMTQIEEIMMTRERTSEHRPKVNTLISGNSNKTDGDSFIDQLRLLRQTALKLDQEGRCVITHHGGVVIINLYCPALRRDASDQVDRIRLETKLNFHKLLHLCVREIQLYSTATQLPPLTHSTPSPVPVRVIVIGDLNVKPFIEDSSDPLAWRAERSSRPFIKQTESEDITNSHVTTYMVIY